MNRPDWFAAVAPICGAGDSSTAHRIVSTPTWAVHSNADLAVPVHHSQQIIAAVQRAGGISRYAEIPGPRLQAQWSAQLDVSTTITQYD